MSDKTHLIISIIIFTTYFTFLFALLFIEVPIENRDIINIAAGALIASFTNITSFYFKKINNK